MNLAQDGAAALHGTCYTVAGNAQRTALQQHLRGVFDLFQPLPGHIKHAELIGRAITVFGCPQDTVREHLVPLKVEHGIHNVLHDFRACNGTVLVDVANDEHGNLLLFGHRQQPGGTLFYLADRAGRRRDIHATHGLNGIDDDQFRLFFLDQAADLIHVVFCGEINIFLGYFQAGCPQFDLAHGFLAGNIQHGVLVGDGTAELQQHGGLADTRLTTQQNHAAQYDTAAQHPIKL